MNSLSWFLYFASVLPQIMIAPILLTLGAMIVLGGIGCSERECGYRGDEQWQRGYKLHKFVAFVLAPLFSLFVVIATIIPDKETLYLIAGSELGQQVIETPEAREVFNDIKTIIKQQIKKSTEGTN